MENHFFKNFSIVLFTTVAILFLNSCKNNITEPKVISAFEITNLTSKSTAEGNIILEWDNPLNSKFNGVEISCISSEYKNNISLNKNINTYTVYGLTKDVILTSTVKAIDLAGKITAGMTVKDTPRITKLNNIIIEAENNLRQIPENDNSTKIILKYHGCNDANISIKFTIDGSEVTESSPEYLNTTIIKPTIDNPKITVKAKAFKQGVFSTLSEKTYYKATITYNDLNQLKSFIRDQMNTTNLGPNGDYNFIGFSKSLTNLSNLFDYNFNGNISAWDVSNIKIMDSIFADASIFNQPLNEWDVSNVENMNCMFKNASDFNQSLNDWNVLNVTNMDSMFAGATSFNQSLNDWNVSKVKNMNCMFRCAESFNQPLNEWNVSNVENMNCLFARAESFNQPLNNWNVSNVKDMSYLLSSVHYFNFPLNKWNVLNVTNMDSMFAGATSFNQSLNDWNVSNVENMDSMFAYATSFNQPLNNWNVSKVENMDSMFNNAKLFNQNLNNWQGFLSESITHVDIITGATSMENSMLPIQLK